MRLAVLTSGETPRNKRRHPGGRPGGLDKRWEVLGGRHGFAGLLAEDDISLGGVIQRGGTMVGSSRCLELTTAEGR